MSDIQIVLLIVGHVFTGVVSHALLMKRMKNVVSLFGLLFGAFFGYVWFFIYLLDSLSNVEILDFRDKKD